MSFTALLPAFLLLNSRHCGAEIRPTPTCPHCPGPVRTSRGVLKPASPFLRLLTHPQSHVLGSPSSPMFVKLSFNPAVAPAFSCGINLLLIIAGSPLFTSTIVFIYRWVTSLYFYCSFYLRKPLSLVLQREGTTETFFTVSLH